MAAARGTEKGRETEGPEAGHAGHADHAAATRIPIENRSRTEPSASLEAFARHGCPKVSN